jgi:hypothetical protein
MLRSLFVFLLGIRQAGNVPTSDSWINPNDISLSRPKPHRKKYGTFSYPSRKLQLCASKASATAMSILV